jgi:hypothetical protein
MPLDLLVPDLLLPPDAPAAMREFRLPALERWLARADVERGAAKSAMECLASAYALAPPPPVAGISLVGEGPPPRPSPKGEGEKSALSLGRGVGGEGVLRADPVHLRVARDSLTLHDASILDVTREEADALVAALQALFAPEIEFHASAPDRWYARVAAAELPVTTPLDRARGCDVFGMLPAGKGRINWRSAITEAQMVLSGHEVNVKREAAGLPAVNSVWFWGEGAVPAALAKPYSDIHAKDVFSAGLAALSGARLHGVPRGIAGIDLVGENDTALVVLDALTKPLHRVDVAGWCSQAAAMDDAWFRELGEAIARFERVRLVLPSERGSRIATLTPASRRRWFRRGKPLATHA